MFVRSNLNNWKRKSYKHYNNEFESFICDGNNSVVKKTMNISLLLLWKWLGSGVWSFREDKFAMFLWEKFRSGLQDWLNFSSNHFQRQAHQHFQTLILFPFTIYSLLICWIVSNSSLNFYLTQFEIGIKDPFSWRRLKFSSIIYSGVEKNCYYSVFHELIENEGVIDLKKIN